MMESEQRVFIHELGHFVAHELNHKYYNGTGVAEVLIHSCDENTNETCGSCKPINNGNENNPVPIERLAEYLAVTIHGCIFQAYFMKQDWNECMCGSTNGNGGSDVKQWLAALNNNQQSNFNFAEIENNFFKKIVTEKSLEGFCKLKLQDYKDYTYNNTHTISIEKLREDVAISLEMYYPVYQELINQYRLKIRYPKG
jgi:hypothetical protein